MLKIMKPAKNSISGTFILLLYVLHCTEHSYWIGGSETFKTIPYMTTFFLSLQIYHKKRVTSFNGILILKMHLAHWYMYMPFCLGNCGPHQKKWSWGIKVGVHFSCFMTILSHFGFIIFSMTQRLLFKLQESLFPFLFSPFLSETFQTNCSSCIISKQHAPCRLQFVLQQVAHV